MTELSKVIESDKLAQTLFSQKRWQECIAQNLKTAEYLGQEVPDILNNIADCYFWLGRPDESLIYWERYMNLIPNPTVDDIRRYCQYLTRSGKYDQAYQLVRERQIESNSKHLDLGWFLHRENKFKEAFIETEIGRSGAVWCSNSNGTKQPPDCKRWQGELIRNTKICVVAEGGYGDEIIFCRWLANLKNLGADVYYMTNNSLKFVICRNFNVKAHDETTNYDYWVPLMSLPYVLEVDEPCNQPYLTPNSVVLAKWQQRLGRYDNLIAVNWSGDKRHSENVFRTIPVDYLVSKIKDKGTLISVCVGHEPCPEGVIDLTKDIETWDDTLAILSLCKMCFTASSSVSVAAGALGINTFLYDIVVGYFTWCGTENGSKTNWFPNVWVWRQDKLTDWVTPINKSIEYLNGSSLLT